MNKYRLEFSNNLLKGSIHIIQSHRHMLNSVLNNLKSSVQRLFPLVYHKAARPDSKLLTEDKSECKATTCKPLATY